MDSETINPSGGPEFAEIESEIAELTSFFGDLGLDEDNEETSSSVYSELDAALAGTEFAEEVESSSAGSTFLDMADGDDGGLQEGWGFPNPVKYIAKKVARKVIKWVLKYVKKAAKFRKCAAKISSALRAYKRGKYGTALKRAYSAAKCVRAQF